MRHTLPGRARRVLAAAASAVALLALPATAQAGEGDLDPSFNGNGKVTTPIGTANDRGNAVAIDSQGRIVVAGQSSNGSNNDFALARFKPDGTLDTSFNGTGKVATPIGTAADVASAVAIDSQGRIVAAGWSFNGSNNDFAVVRYEDDGTLDTSFGGTGKVTTAVGSSDDQANAVAIDSQGRIVVAGASFASFDYDFAIARYKPDGTLDPALNGTGKVLTPVGVSDDTISAVQIDAQGRIVAAGYGHNGSNYDFALARYDSGGSLDASFNGTGKQLTAIGNLNDFASALTIDDQGRIIAVGDTFSYSSDRDFALVRYDATGALDTSFGGSGKVTTAIVPDEDVALGVAVDGHDRVVAGGWSSNGSDADFALARYHSNGTLDDSFDGNGTAATPIGSGDDIGRAVAIDSKERIVLAGRSFNGSNDDFALARYIGDATAPTVTIDSGPADGGFTRDTTPSFSFSADEPNVDYECRFDSDPFNPCTGPGGHEQAPFDLAEGSHTFDVRATDPAGNTGAAASRSFTVDTTPPDANLTSGPDQGDFTSDSTPTFDFASSEASSTFECRFESQGFATCTGPFTPGSPLDDGSHRFFVRAIDQAGNVGDPADVWFTVDTDPPAVVISSGPANGSVSPDRDPSFAFGADEEGVRFKCNLDSAGFADCSSPFPANLLADGPHTFAVKGTDRAGNVSNTASRSWTVDGGGPVVSITSGPAYGSFTNDSTPTFAFSSSEGGSTFQCRYEGHSFGACSGPGATDTPATPLGDGPHTFFVRAIDAAGNVGDPLDIAFTADTQLPAITITGPSKVWTKPPKKTAKAEYTISTSEPAALACKVDAKAFAACSSPYRTALPKGKHTLTVRAIDRAGNAATQSKAFKVLNPDDRDRR